MYDVSGILEEPELREPLRASLQSGGPSPFLRSIKLKLTARCNLRCTMCRYGRGDSPPELPTSRWLAVIDEMAGLGVRKLHFSGGEVLVRPDLEELLARAIDQGIKVTLTSNLSLLTRERTKTLGRLKLGGISTSLDGASAKVHDAIRGVEGAFRRTLRGIARLRDEALRRERRFRLRVNLVLMRRNFRVYPDLVRLAGRLGATDVVPMPVDSKRSGLRLSPRLIEEYNREIAPRVLEARAEAGFPEDPRAIHPFGTDPRAIACSAEGQYALGYYEKHPCFAPWLHSFLTWDGEVYPCCMTRGRTAPLGDLRHQTLGSVLADAPYRQLRLTMLQERLPSCHACDMWLGENRKLLPLLGAPAQSPSPVAWGG